MIVIYFLINHWEWIQIHRGGKNRESEKLKEWYQGPVFG